MSTLRALALGYIRLLEAVGIFAIALVAIVAVLQVWFRYVMGASLYWSEELMRYTTIWSVFLLAGLAFSRGEMMGFTMLVDAVPAFGRRLVKTTVRLVILVFLLTIAWYGWDFAMRTAGDKAIALRVSMFWVHLAVPVGCLLMAGHVVAAQFLPEPDPVEEEIARADDHRLDMHRGDRS